MGIEIECHHCGAKTTKPAGAVNRARRNGAPVYCGRVCAGLGRRKNRTLEEKKRLKAEYDKEYRAKNIERIKAQKREYHFRTYDPEVARQWRQTPHRKAYHNEYCKRPENRAKDRVRYAKRRYGEFADAFKALQELETEILSQQSRREIGLELGRYGKTLKRKRDYERTQRCKPETGPLGNIEPSKVR